MSDSKDPFLHSNPNPTHEAHDSTESDATEKKAEQDAGIRAAMAALDDELQTFAINLVEELLHQKVAGFSVASFQGAIVRGRLQFLLSAKPELKGVADNYLLGSLDNTFADLCSDYPNLLDTNLLNLAAEKIKELARWADRVISIEEESLNILEVHIQLRGRSTQLRSQLQPGSEKCEGMDHIQSTLQLVTVEKQRATVTATGLKQLWSDLGAEREGLYAVGIKVEECGLCSQTEVLPEFGIFASEIAEVLGNLEQCEQILKEIEAVWLADKDLLEKALEQLNAGDFAQVERTQAMMSKRPWGDLDISRISAALQSELDRLLHEVDALVLRKKLQAVDLAGELAQTFEEGLAINRQLKERQLMLMGEIEAATRERELAEARALKTRKRILVGLAGVAIVATTVTLLFQRHANAGRLAKAQTMMEKWRAETVEEEAAFFEQNFKRIPGGSFEMGAPEESDAPLHTVKVKAFSIAATELTYGEWSKVRSWAVPFGYVFEKSGEGGGEEHPVTNVSWYDAVKYCNAKSERAGLKPCYYTSTGRAFADVYRVGNKNLSALMVDWDADGYRLPTEAEWEKAARGGASGQRYPNGVNLTKNDANYDDSKGGTRKVKCYPPNDFGLYDMAGNVWEWCWDWYGSGYEGSNRDPHGPDRGDFRVVRGGGWSNHLEFCRVAYRDNYGPRGANGLNGFRLVRK